MLLCISVRRREQRRGKGESIPHPQNSSLKSGLSIQRRLDMLSLLSVNSVFMGNLTVIGEWIPLCFHSEESALGQCAGIFQLKHGKTQKPWECVMNYEQLLLRLATFAVTGVLCAGLQDICIYRELPISTKTKNIGQTDLVLGNFGKDKCITYAMASKKVFRLSSDLD